MTSAHRHGGPQTVPGGLLIVIEGIGGSGKSTLARGLADSLERDGWQVVRTKEPGGTELGQALRTILLSAATQIDPWTEAFLFEADRAQTNAEVLVPALAAGSVVISDRGPFGTVAYQGHGRALDVELIEAMSDAAWRGRRADLVVVVDVEPRVGMARKRGATEADRFDDEDLAFQARVRDGYLAAARRRGPDTLVIDGSRPAEAGLAEVTLGAREYVAARAADSRYER